MNTLYIFLDDIREPSDSQWLIVRDAGVAYELLLNAHTLGQEVILSLDHDLGENVPTGYDLLSWLERDIHQDKNFRPKVTFCIHSANPVGRDNMDRAIQSINQVLKT